MKLPRTSRFRGGNAFSERKSLAWAGTVGFLLGRGYSSVAVADAMADGTHPATIRALADRRWHLPKFGSKASGFEVVIGMRQRDRKALRDRANAHGIDLEEYCRRILLCASMPRDLYAELQACERTSPN